MFYCGAGTGGKLAVLDMLEIPNTYGVSPDMIQCVLAGGVENLVLDLEEKEDDVDEGWRTLQENTSAHRTLSSESRRAETLRMCWRPSKPVMNMVFRQDRSSTILTLQFRSILTTLWKLSRGRNLSLEARG